MRDLAVEALQAGSLQIGTKQLRSCTGVPLASNRAGGVGVVKSQTRSRRPSSVRRKCRAPQNPQVKGVRPLSRTLAIVTDGETTSRFAPHHQLCAAALATSSKTDAA